MVSFLSWVALSDLLDLFHPRKQLVSPPRYLVVVQTWLLLPVGLAKRKFNVLAHLTTSVNHLACFCNVRKQKCSSILIGKTPTSCDSWTVCPCSRSTARTGRDVGNPISISLSFVLSPSRAAHSAMTQVDHSSRTWSAPPIQLQLRISALIIAVVIAFSGKFVVDFVPSNFATI